MKGIQTSLAKRAAATSSATLSGGTLSGAVLARASFGRRFAMPSKRRKRFLVAAFVRPFALGCVVQCRRRDSTDGLYLCSDGRRVDDARNDGKAETAVGVGRSSHRTPERRGIF